MPDLIEIDPLYVDVIVKRWQDYMGRKAVLERDGREFEQIAFERSRKNQDYDGAEHTQNAP
jgi:hypothetical protein